MLGSVLWNRSIAREGDTQNLTAVEILIYGITMILIICFTGIVFVFIIAVTSIWCAYQGMLPPVEGRGQRSRGVPRGYARHW